VGKPNNEPNEPTEREQEVSTYLQFAEVRDKFRTEAHKMYPNSAQPEMCWLFDMVLKIDPRVVAMEPITLKKYKVFMMDLHGKRMVNPKTNEFYRVTRYFSPEQIKEVRNWWPLLPQEMRAS
jgi:hypothetical protein